MLRLWVTVSEKRCLRYAVDTRNFSKLKPDYNPNSKVKSNSTPDPGSVMPTHSLIPVHNPPLTRMIGKNETWRMVMSINLILFSLWRNSPERRLALFLLNFQYIAYLIPVLTHICPWGLEILHSQKTYSQQTSKDKETENAVKQNRKTQNPDCHFSLLRYGHPSPVFRVGPVRLQCTLLEAWQGSGGRDSPHTQSPRGLKNS